MRAEELLDRLREFGLDEREAYAYYHLARLGPSGASALSEASDLKRTEVYRVMDQLVAKGFVEATLERPRRFVPVPVQAALSHAIAERRAELEGLESASSEVVEAWPRVQVEADSAGRFAVHQGRAQIAGLLTRLVEGAREEVLIVALRRGLARLDSIGLFEALAERDENLNVRVLTQVDDTNRDAARNAAKVAQVRHVELPGYLQMVVADNSEIALFVAMDPVVSTSTAGETVLWLNSPDLILAQRSLFDLLWSMGIDHGDRAAELDAGVPSEQAAVVRGRWTRTNRLKAMLLDANRDVLLVLGPAGLGRLGPTGVGTALERLAAKGISIRLLANGGPAPSLQGVEAREADLPLGTELCIVDERELLLALGASEEPDSLTYEGEWSLHASHPREIAALSRALGAAWDGAARPVGRVRSSDGENAAGAA